MRFSIVSYLDLNSTREVREIQNELGKLTGARASLELWRPHVTVGDGIEVSDDDLEALKARLEEVASTAQPFEVSMRDILKIDFRKGGAGEVTTPYGLYLDVKINEALISLVDAIDKISEGLPKWYFMPSPFHPHCALAFKDLTKEGYEIGSRYLDNQSLSINARIDHIALVEMLPNETRELARFSFV